MVQLLAASTLCKRLPHGSFHVLHHLFAGMARLSRGEKDLSQMRWQACIVADHCS